MASRPSLSRPLISQQPSELCTSTTATKEHEPDFPQSSDEEPPPQGPRFRIILLALLSAAGMVAALGGLGTVLVLYIFFQNTWEWTRKEDMLGRFEITTGAEATQLLLFSSIATKVAGWMVAPIMSISAISCAAAVLGDQKKARPTPAQLSMGISVLGGANIMTLFKGMGMLCGFTSTAKRHAHSTKLSSFVRRSILLLFWLTSLEALLAGADFALHKTTKATFTASRPTPDPGPMRFSRGFNQSYCSRDNERCNLADYELYDWGRTKPPARQALSNSSVNSVAWLEDGTAIMVSSQTPSFSYEANSVGVTAGCESLTRSSCSTTPSGNPTILTFDCMQGPIRYNASQYGIEDSRRSLTVLHDHGFLAPDGNILPYYDLTPENISNPFYVGMVAQSWTYIPAEAMDGQGTYLKQDPQFFKDTGFYYYSSQRGSFNVLRCSLTPKNIRFRFDAPTKTYTTIQATNASSQVVFWFSLQADYWLIDSAPTADGVAFTSGRAGEYEAAFSRYYARSLVAGVALAIEATTEGVVIGDSFGQGSTVNVIVFGVYLGALAVLIATIMLVALGGLIAWLTTSKRGHLQAVQLLLLGPEAVICQLLGSPAPDALKKNDPLEIFASATDADRLVTRAERHKSNGNWTMQVHRL